MKNHENSTFYEEKKRYKEVKRRLEENEIENESKGIKNTLIFKEIEVIEPTKIYKKDLNLNEDDSFINLNKDISINIDKDSFIDLNKDSIINLNENSIINQNSSINIKSNSDPFEILNILINFISNTIQKLCKNKSINEMKDFKNNKIETTTKNIENLIKLVHSSTLLLKNTNDVLYSVLNKMNEVCKNAILNNPTLFGLVENLLLKFCEVQDLLDFDQEDYTIETLFEMSKMIFIYKNKVNEIIKSEDINLNEDYKKKTFGFFYSETNKENNKNVLKGMEEEEEGYTDWSTWIESFIEEKGDDLNKSHELNLAKRKALIRKDGKIKIKTSLEINSDRNLNSPTINNPTFESIEQPLTQTNLPQSNLPQSNTLYTTTPRNLLHTTLSQTLSDTTLPQSNLLNTTTPQNLLPTISDDDNQLPCFTTQEISDILNFRTVKFANFLKFQNKLEKIGEATFSEVFKSGIYVFKIIPLGDKEDQTTYDVFIREAFIQQCIRREKGICFIQDVFLIKGKYPVHFLKAWDNFGQVENPRPSKYKEDQLFGVIRMTKGPIPLEKVDFKKLNLFRFVKMLSKILYDLEEKFEFEHRDLHWGNILVGTQSILIIDFTLSRIKCGFNKNENDSLIGDNGLNTSFKGKIVYNDLSKYKWLFEGDASVDEQFEIYRKMRDACKGDWASFNPSSNFYWVDYLARKIKTEIEKYRSLNEEEKMIIYILKDTKTLKELNFLVKRSGFDEDKMRFKLFYK